MLWDVHCWCCSVSTVDLPCSVSDDSLSTVELPCSVCQTSVTVRLLLVLLTYPVVCQMIVRTCQPIQFTCIK